MSAPSKMLANVRPGRRRLRLPTRRLALAGLLCISLGAHGYPPRLQPIPHRVRCAAPISEQRPDPPSPSPPPRPTAAPFSQSEVPTEQQPTYELNELRTEAFFTWPEREGFQRRLVYIWLPATLVISMPISLSTYDVQQQLPAVLLAANVGGSAVLVAFLLRLRAGWGYVSERLRARETYYEENGASGRGGYVVEKEAELLLRDRLLDKYQVQPPLAKVDSALRIAAASLVASFTLLRLVAAPFDPYEQYGQAYLSRLESDSSLAQREQERARQSSPKPAYCGSRYYSAIAGGGSSGFCN